MYAAGPDAAIASPITNPIASFQCTRPRVRKKIAWNGSIATPGMWLEAIASDAATHESHAIRSPVRNHHSRHAVESAENIHSIMYILPSRLYPSRYAEHADT